MSSIFDSMIPSRRREQKRLRDAENRLREQGEDIHISAPNNGCWMSNEHTPELAWSSPSTLGCVSPDLPSGLSYTSPELGVFGEQVVIFDSETCHEEPELEKNSITFTIPLPWPSRKGHSRSPSATQTKASANNVFQRSPAFHSSQSSIVYKPTSDQYMKELDGISRGSSPAQSATGSAHHTSPKVSLEPGFRQTSLASSMGMGFARRSPSPPVDQEEGQNISAIMLLSPVVEDFPSRPKAPSTFTRAASQHHVGHFTRQIPSPPPERPSTAMSSHSTLARSETATAVTEISYHTALTHHPTRSSSRGPGLERTGMMRSASREPGPRRAISREPTDRRAISREPTTRRPISPELSDRRAISREPLDRRAMSREPTRRRAMTNDSTLLHRGQSLENLRYGAPSRGGRRSIETESPDDASEVDGKVSNSSATTVGSYYASLADEYRHIAWNAAPSSDSDSVVGRVGKVGKEKPKEKVKVKPKSKEEKMAAIVSKELVPGGEDLFS